MTKTKSEGTSESKKLTITDIKKSLKSYDKEALVSMLIDCYKQSREVKNYIHVLLNPEEAIKELYQTAKNQISNEFFPDRGFGKMRLAVAKKAISDYKKLSNDEASTIDLMIYYVEVGVEFTNTYGDINDSFYNSMVTMYSNAIDKLMDKPILFIQYKQRLQSIVHNTRGIGWGFHDELGYLYGNIAVELDEEYEE